MTTRVVQWGSGNVGRSSIATVARRHDLRLVGLGSTAAHAINAIPYVMAAGPGVKTFLDLPLIAGRGAATTAR